MLPRGLKTAHELGTSHPHGVRIKYMSGCRCLKCRMANANYETRRAAARRHGDGNGLVDAASARAHLRKLSRGGVGYKTVADAASIGRTAIALILSGRRTKIRASSSKRILAVTKMARADASLVPAGPTWQRIENLLAEGFSKARIAQELGMRTPALQIGKRRVLARTELAVAKLWRKYMQ